MPMSLEGRVLGVLYLGRNGGERPFAQTLVRDLSVVCAMCVPLLVQWRRPKAETSEHAEDAVEAWLEGEHASMVELRRVVDRVAPSTLAVYVRGETGAGKELVARALHAKSPRRDRAFVAVNCAAVAENLLAAELFGVKKGAFTGATHDREGLIESVRGGTLFLDEVGDMPASMQAALLRVLERREIVRVGDTVSRAVDFRLVCATHRALDEEVTAGRFRADLLFRLREMTIEIPPLRDRGDDVLLLARRFAKLAASEMGERVPSFSSDALRRLREHPFPGNVRELRATVRRAVVLADGGVVQEHDLGLGRAAPGPEVKAAASAAPIEGTLDDAWRKFSTDYAARALERAGNNRELAATTLGISVRTLYRLLSER
jgi:DNA-binding NtrC family response regulator